MTGVSAYFFKDDPDKKTAEELSRDPLDQSMIEYIEAQWPSWDKENEGLNSSHFKESLYYLEIVDQGDSDRIFDLVDTSRDGRISLNEYLKWWMECKHYEDSLDMTLDRSSVPPNLGDWYKGR